MTSPVSTHPRRRAGAVAAIALLCAGCAGRLAAPPYLGPASGPSARLLLRAQVGAGDRYAAFVHTEPLACGAPARLGVGDSTRHPPSARLAAGQLATLEFQLYKPDRSYCTVIMSFTPVAGRAYLLSGTALQGGCLAGVHDATDPEQLRPLDDIRRRNPVGTACVPLAQSTLMRRREDTARVPDSDAVLLRGSGSSDLSGLVPR